MTPALDSLYHSIVSYTVDGRTYIRYYDSSDTILEVDSCTYINDIIYVEIDGKTYFVQRNQQNEFTLHEGTCIGSDSDMIYFSVGNEIFCKDEKADEITIVYTLEGSFTSLYFSGTYLTILYANNKLILYDIVTKEELDLSHLYAIEGSYLTKNYGRITITVGESVYLTGAFVSNTGSRKLDCVLLDIHNESYSYGVGGGNFLYSYTDTIIRYLPITGENFKLGNRYVTYTNAGQLYIVRSLINDKIATYAIDNAENINHEIVQSSDFSIIDTGKASTSFLYCDNEIIPGLFTCERNWFSYITTITNTQTSETYLYNERSKKWIAKNVLSITNVKVNSDYGIITYHDPTDGISIYMYTTGNVPYIPPAEFGKFLEIEIIAKNDFKCLMVFEQGIITVSYSQFRAIGYSLGKKEVADFYYTRYNIMLEMQNGDIIVLDNSAKAVTYSLCSLSIFNNNYNSPIYAIKADDLYYFYNADSKFLFSERLMLTHWEIDDAVMTIQHHYYYCIGINIATGEILKKYTLPTNETNLTIHVGENFSLIYYNDEVLEIPVVINIAKISDNRTLILYCQDGFYLYDLVEQKIILQRKSNF